MQSIKRNYSLTDAELMLYSSNLVGFMNRDAAKFLERGVTAGDISAFAALTNAFEVILPDEVYAAQITAEVEAKNVKRAEALAMIQSISGYVQQEWGINSWQYKSLTISNASAARDNEFLRTCRVVVEQATDFLTDLSAIGLTLSDIEALESKAQELESKLNSVNEKRALRDKKKQERIEKGNELYSFVKKYTTIGKLMWENVSEADYNDYIIYKSTPELPSKVLNLSYDTLQTKLKWSESSLAEQYQLEMKREGPTFDWESIYEGEEEEFVYTPESGIWLFRCRGVNSNGAGSWSDEINVVQIQSDTNALIYIGIELNYDNIASLSISIAMYSDEIEMNQISIALRSVGIELNQISIALALDEIKLIQISVALVLDEIELN